MFSMFYLCYVIIIIIPLGKFFNKFILEMKKWTHRFSNLSKISQIVSGVSVTWIRFSWLWSLFVIDRADYYSKDEAYTIQ